MTAMNARINLNTATIEELEPITGIGPALARRIVAWRDESGPFNSVDDLTAVKGIGPVLVDKLMEVVTVSDNNWPAATRTTGILSDVLTDPHDVPVDEVVESISDDEEEMEEAEAVEPVLERIAEPDAEAEEYVSGDPHEAPVEEPDWAAQSIARTEEAAEAVADGILEEAEAIREEMSVEVRPAFDPSGDPHEALVEEQVEAKPEPKPAPTAAPAATRARSAEEKYELPPPLEIVEPRSGRLTFWKGLLLVLLGGLLGGALALGAVWLTNGTLDFGSRNQVFALQGEVAQMRADRDSLERQIGDLEGQLVQMRQDMTVLPQIRSDIEQVGERAGALQDEVAGVQGDLGILRSDLVGFQADVAGLGEQIGAVDGRVDEMDAQFAGMVERVDVIQGEMDHIAEQAERFDGFLLGLRALLQDTVPAE